jgi:hypothetical protein
MLLLFAALLQDRVESACTIEADGAVSESEVSQLTDRPLPIVRALIYFGFAHRLEIKVLRDLP